MGVRCNLERSRSESRCRYPFSHATRSSCHRLKGYIPNHSNGLDSDSRMSCPFKHLSSTLIRWNRAMDVRHNVGSRQEGFKLEILKSVSILILMQGTNHYGYRTVFNNKIIIILSGSLRPTILASYRAGKGCLRPHCRCKPFPYSMDGLLCSKPSRFHVVL